MMTISTQKETDVIEKKSPEEIRIERLEEDRAGAVREADPECLAPGDAARECP